MGYHGDYEKNKKQKVKIYVNDYEKLKKGTKSMLDDEGKYICKDTVLSTKCSKKDLKKFRDSDFKLLYYN